MIRNLALCDRNGASRYSSLRRNQYGNLAEVKNNGRKMQKPKRHAKATKGGSSSRSRRERHDNAGIDKDR